MSNYVVFYCKVVEDKDLGILVDFPFYGGESDYEDEAERIAKDLVNAQQQSQVTIIPKVFAKKGLTTMNDVMEEARKRFDKMANEMYDCETAMIRRKKKS